MFESTVLEAHTHQDRIKVGAGLPLVVIPESEAVRVEPTAAVPEMVGVLEMPAAARSVRGSVRSLACDQPKLL